MVNYERLVCEATALLTCLALAVAAPITGSPDRHIDQSQNGSTNYRVNVDGVVFAFVPAESLLAAVSDFDISDLLDLENFNEISKPKPSVTTQPPAPLAIIPDVSGSKPEPEKPGETPLSDVSMNSDIDGQKTDAIASLRKQEKSQRLKHRLANILVPLLQRARHL